jgi:hypothetical protein
MENKTTNDEKLIKAKKRASDKVGALGHLMIYVLVNTGLFILNLITSPGTWWVQWTMFGWGIGLAVHLISVFVLDGFLSNLEQKFIEEEMKK